MRIIKNIKYFKLYIISLFLCLFLFSHGTASSKIDTSFTEQVRFRSLGGNKTLVKFIFKQRTPYNEHGSSFFPRNIYQILKLLPIQYVHVSLSQGHWDFNNWGYINEHVKPIGLEIESTFFSPSRLNSAFLRSSAIQNAKDTCSLGLEYWPTLIESLGATLGFSASLVSTPIVVRTKEVMDPGARLGDGGGVKGSNPRGITQDLYAVSPREALCSENLRPWIQLLPYGSRSGAAAVLANATSIFDSHYSSLQVEIQVSSSAALASGTGGKGICNEGSEGSLEKKKMEEESFESTAFIQLTQRLLIVVDSVEKALLFAKRLPLREEGMVKKEEEKEMDGREQNQIHNEFHNKIHDNRTVGYETKYDIGSGDDSVGRSFFTLQRFVSGSGLVRGRIVNDLVRVTTSVAAAEKEEEGGEVKGGEEEGKRCVEEEAGGRGGGGVKEGERREEKKGEKRGGKEREKRGGEKGGKKGEKRKEDEVCLLQIIPWYIRIWIHTTKIRINGKSVPFESKWVSRQLVRTGASRHSPLLWELCLFASLRNEPRNGEVEQDPIAVQTIRITTQFSKGFLTIGEYPPDGLRGFEIPAAIATSSIEAYFNGTSKNWTETNPYARIMRENGFSGGEEAYTMKIHGPGLLVPLAEPDFSMPYNVVSLSSMVLVLYFSCLVKLLTNQPPRKMGLSLLSGWVGKRKRKKEARSAEEGGGEGGEKTDRDRLDVDANRKGNGNQKGNGNGGEEHGDSKGEAREHLIENSGDDYSGDDSECSSDDETESQEEDENNQDQNDNDPSPTCGITNELKHPTSGNERRKLKAKRQRFKRLGFIVVLAICIAGFASAHDNGWIDIVGLFKKLSIIE